MKRKMLWAVALGLAVVFVGGYLLLSSAGKVVKYGIEEYGPGILGVPVKVKSVLILPMIGSGSVRGLVIGNPKGYKEENLFEVDSMSLKLDLGSLLSDTIQIKEIGVNGPKVNWEGTLEKSNVTQIQENIAKSLGTSQKKSTKKWFIRRLEIKDTRVTARIQGADPLKLPIGNILLTNLNSTDGPQKIIGTVVGQMTSKIVGELAKNVVAKEAEKAAGKAVEGVVKGIKGLFGN